MAIMDLFAATLLTDLSAAEVAAQLAERGVSVDRDIAEARCRQLADWGNLVPSHPGCAGEPRSPSTSGRGPGTRCRSSAGGCTGRRSRSCTPATGLARWPGSCSARSSSPSTASWPCWTAATQRRSTRRRWPARSPRCSATSGCSRTASGTSTPTWPAILSRYDLGRRGVRAVQGAPAGLHRPDHRRRQPARPGGRPPGRPGPGAGRSAAGRAGRRCPASRCRTAPRSSGPRAAPTTDWEELAAWYDASHGASGPGAAPRRPRGRRSAS